ncbi:MAG: DUF4864 domain-containing protein [Gammaproteobacteria bacterium]|nr:DUF4864 domain-containing protein [Gammaproteobacteria bacterium]
MRYPRPLIGMVLCLGGFLSLAQGNEVDQIQGDYVTIGSETGDEDLFPNRNLSPADVIRIQIRALGRNDIPHKNAGIEIAFRFASPRNKLITGPLPRFIQLVSNPVYRPMLNHRQAEYGPLQIEGVNATRPVFLTASDGQRVGYLFTLSRQDGGACDACWMTDGVIRFEVHGDQDRLLTI